MKFSVSEKKPQTDRKALVRVCYRECMDYCLARVNHNTSLLDTQYLWIFHI